MAFPTTGVLDDFNRDDGAIGDNYTLMFGTIFTIVSNKLETVGNYHGVYWDPGTFGPDSETYLTIVAEGSNDYPTVHARLQNPGSSFDSYATQWGIGNLCQLLRYDDGTETVLAEPSVTRDPGDKFGVECIGSAIKSYYDTGSGWTQSSNITDSTYSSAGYAGITIYDNNANVAEYDNFGGGTVVSTPSVTPAENTQSQTQDAATCAAIYPITVAEGTQTQTQDAVTCTAQSPSTLTAIGPLYPTVVTTASVAPFSNDDWVNPTNVTADDTNYAVIVENTFDAPDYSYLMSARSFGATVPSDGTISGVLGEIGKWYSAGGAVDGTLQFINGVGTALGTSMASPSAWPSAIATVSYGGSTNQWGATLTPSIVNGTAFGLQFAAQASSPNTDINVDFLRLTIYYYPNTGAPSVAPAEGSQTQTGDAATANAIYPFTVAEGSQTQTQDAATVSYFGPQYPITVAEGAQAQTGDAATANAIYLLTIAEGNQTQTQDAATATIPTSEVNVTPAEGSQVQTQDAATYSAIYPITGAENAQTQTGDAATANAVYPFTVAEGNQTQTQDAVTCSVPTSEVNVTPAENAQTQTGDAATCNAIYPFTVAEGTQSQTQDAVTCSYSGPGAATVTPEDGAQTQTQDAITCSVIYPVTVGEGNQTQTQDAITCSAEAPSYYVTVSEGSQTQVMDAIVIGGIVYIVAPAEGSQTMSMDLISASSSSEGYRVEARPGVRVDIGADNRENISVGARANIKAR